MINSKKNKVGLCKLKKSSTLLWASIIFLFAVLIIWVLGDYLNPKAPKLFALGGDNYDITYTMYSYFFTELQEGRIAYYNPYLWAGARLIGDPNFQLNIFQILAGLIKGVKGVLYFTSFYVIAERIVAAIGFFALLKRLSTTLPTHIIFLLSTAYVFSIGYHAVSQFPSTSVSLAILPWALFILTDLPKKIISAKTILLSLLLAFMFSYGQLQFSIYACWIIGLFTVFFIQKNYRRHAIRLLTIAVSIALLLSAYYVIPFIDNVYISGSSGRALSIPSFKGELVPPFYLLRLFIPGIYNTGGWWPIWVDGWTSWEAFCSFQGIAITEIAIFGLFLKKIPVFFRVGYMFIILTVTTKLGVCISYLINLGTTVPYGRETVLLGFFAPILAAYTIKELINNPELPLYFAAWSALVFGGIYLLSQPTILNYFVKFIFSSAIKIHPHSRLLHNPVDFIETNISTFNHIFLFSKIIAASILFFSIYQVFIAKNIIAHYPKKETWMTFSFSIILLINSYEIICFYKSVDSRLPNDLTSDNISLNKEHPAEIKLKSLTSNEKTPLISYRTHTDIYFGEHRQGTESVNGQQVRRLINATPDENRFRTLPNFLALDKIAVTTGYSSLIPQAKSYSKMMAWIPNFPGYERAVGDRGHMHPGFLDIFSIRWILRHQSNLIKTLDGRNNWDDQIEISFRKNSKLIYEDDAYQIFEYKNAHPLIYFPERILFGENVVSTMSNAFDSISWVSTAVISDHLIKKLPKEIQERIVRSSASSKELRQSGTILSARGFPSDHMLISIKTDTSSILLLGIKYDNWWKVYINGKPTPMVKVNDIFGGVIVPAGESTIQVKLKPYSAIAGFSLSVITAAFLLIWFLFNLISASRQAKHIKYKNK